MYYSAACNSINNTPKQNIVVDHQILKHVKTIVNLARRKIMFKRSIANSDHVFSQVKIIQV